MNVSSLLFSYDPLNESPHPKLDLYRYRYICLTNFCFIVDHRQYFELSAALITVVQLVPEADRTFKIVVKTYTASGGEDTGGTDQNLDFHLPHNMSRNQERLKPIVAFFDERKGKDWSSITPADMEELRALLRY